MTTKDPLKIAASKRRQAESKRARYAADPEFRERRKTIAKNWYHRANPLPRPPLKDHRYKLLTRAKSRARDFEREFDITVDDIVIPDVCPVLGIKLERKVGSRGPGPSSPSVDRIDSNLGYVRGNVRVISWRANTLRKDATWEETIALYNDAIRIRAQR